jgi:hypothetical protein
VEGGRLRKRLPRYQGSVRCWCIFQDFALRFVLLAPVGLSVGRGFVGMRGCLQAKSLRHGLCGVRGFLSEEMSGASRRLTSFQALYVAGHLSRASPFASCFSPLWG